jgi:hypothetical protein
MHSARTSGAAEADNDAAACSAADALAVLLLCGHEVGGVVGRRRGQVLLLGSGA